MIVKGLTNVQIRDLVVNLALLPFPFIFLVLNLVRSGYWRNALDALRNGYTISGVPSNPWREFLPFFLLAVLAFALLSCLAIVLVKGLEPSFLRLVTNVTLSLLASVAFGFAMDLASIFYLWFENTQVVGSVGSPLLFWSSMLVSFALQLINSYRITLATGIPA